MKHIITFYNDIKMYPPILSAIDYLSRRGDEIVVLGYCSSSEIKNGWKQKGITYNEVIRDDVGSNWIHKLFKLYQYKMAVNKLIEQINACGKALVWVYGVRNAWILHDLFNKYKCVLYLFEMPEFKVSSRFKIISPTVNYLGLANKASAVVCCEYNRAKITQAFLGLKHTPFIIKNKPNLDMSNSILDLSLIDVELDKQIAGKKVILYQGIFNYPERRLSELCESVKYLPNDFIVVLVGDRGVSGDKLKMEFESDRVLFVDFMAFPRYLSLTKKSHIGFLTYNSNPLDLYQALNTLYCAPNKIFEYSMCDLPVISNDLPAMKEVFSQYKFGLAIDNLSPVDIANAILEISDNYDDYKSECSKFSDSFNLDCVIESMLESI